MNATHPLGLAAAGLDVNHPCFTEDDLDLIFDQIPSDTAFSYTVFTKTGGPLTKRISLTPDGEFHSDGSACLMSNGEARRRRTNLKGFAQEIAHLEHSQAIALGQLRHGLPDAVTIVTKAQLGQDHPRDVVARTQDFIGYETNVPALILIDIDTKAIPTAVRQQVDKLGGLYEAIVSVLPELAQTGRVIRPSTSSCLSRTDTGAAVPGSEGAHVFVLATDGDDAERFLKTLHDRLTLADLGWAMVGRAGQVLQRSLVDRSVYDGARLVFEADPALEPPLTQDRTARAPKVYPGPAMDTREILRDLTLVERAKLREIERAERNRVAQKAAKAQEAFVENQATKIVERSKGKITLDAAQKTIKLQIAGTLLPDVVLEFDDEDLRSSTVGDVLADPDKFTGLSLSDPQEGAEYGRGKAKIMRCDDDSLWIHSFAHGRSVYELKYDAASIEAAIMKGKEADAADILVRMLPHAEVDKTAEDRLKALAVARAKVKLRSLGSRIKDAREETREEHARERREHRARSRRHDKRIRLDVPKADEPFVPVMGALNEVLGAATDPEPPMRNVDGAMACVRVRKVPDMHALTADGANGEEAEDTRLPPADLPLLTRLKDAALAELIERYIDFQDPATGRSVHLPGNFIAHFIERDDNILPTVTNIAVLPIVLPNGKLLAKRGLDRQSGICFRIPTQLLEILPKPEDCDDAAVKVAMKFLLDEWLVDVATSHEGKCKAIAAALTLIERSILDERPAFFVTAPRRGGGKTTLLSLLLLAVTGALPSAAAWSEHPEERRKALMSYLLEGVPAIIWDNIVRGSQLSCPHIERSCTAATIEDRRLGFTERVVASACAVHFFTGNNIAPKGDLASRSLDIVLQVDRPDPENRRFQHDVPFEWTMRNRGKILRALYTILLGNPALRPGANTPPPKTRFKTWWRLIGSSIEHASGLFGKPIDFQDLFLQQEDNDEESTSLSDALAAFASWAPTRANKKTTRSDLFTADEIATWLGDTSEFANVGNVIVREFLYPTPTGGHRSDTTFSAKSVSRRLKDHLDEPIRGAEHILTLRPHKPDRWPGVPLQYFVQQS
jgi:hypothetical protein